MRSRKNYPLSPRKTPRKVKCANRMCKCPRTHSRLPHSFAMQRHNPHAREMGHCYFMRGLSVYDFRCKVGRLCMFCSCGQRNGNSDGKQQLPYPHYILGICWLNRGIRLPLTAAICGGQPIGVIQTCGHCNTRYQLDSFAALCRNSNHIHSVILMHETLGASLKRKTIA